MKPYILFDLDGVLVDNVDFEHAVTQGIIQEIARRKRISAVQAKNAWDAKLAEHRDHDRWHDYALHCEALGLPDLWRASHEGLRQLIRPMPRASEAIEVAMTRGSCWLASDATDWVVHFKLRAVGIDPGVFQERFTLDRCGVGKGAAQYWAQVRKCMENGNDHLIYVDNRADRLLVAARAIPAARLLQVTAPDHPLTLDLFRELAGAADARVLQVRSDDLPEALNVVIDETLARP